MAATKSRYTTLFIVRPVKARPLSPTSGPIHEAMMLPQAQTRRPAKTMPEARTESLKCPPKAPTEINNNPFRIPSRWAMRQPRTVLLTSVRAWPAATATTRCRSSLHVDSSRNRRSRRPASPVIPHSAHSSESVPTCRYSKARFPAATVTSRTGRPRTLCCEAIPSISCVTRAMPRSV